MGLVAWDGDAALQGWLLTYLGDDVISGFVSIRQRDSHWWTSHCMDGASVTALIIMGMLLYLCAGCCCVMLGPCKVCRMMIVSDPTWPEESPFLNCVASTTMGPVTCNVVMAVADELREV